MIRDRFLDPRTKLIIVMSISSLSVLIRDISYLICILLGAVVISKIMGSEVLVVLNKLRRFFKVFVAMALIQSLFIRGGNPIVIIGNITILTDIGIIRALEFIIRMAIILVSATLLMTSTSREILQGLIEWKIPYEIAFMVSVGIRFLPMLREELEDNITAIQLRGIDMEKLTFKKKVEIYSYIFTPVVAGAVLKSQRLAMAMECRGFRAFPKRTSYLRLKMKTRDYIISITSILISIFILYIYLI
ncbi:energy-coupling factor transporter transmembrane component T family protein [Wukongibacter sp. M2B1]|uniref:energy-coupling factor transporter transmembrane component T family protein n=1 Tax=Wukongibacter sp. M2B1 TaxID=3088895 RepID=UPI003D7C02BC